MPVDMYPMVVISLIASGAAVAAGAGVTAGVGARIIAAFTYSEEKRTTSSGLSLVYAMAPRTRIFTRMRMRIVLPRKSRLSKLSTNIGLRAMRKVLRHKPCSDPLGLACRG
jgi:hypothetical protein